MIMDNTTHAGGPCPACESSPMGCKLCGGSGLEPRGMQTRLFSGAVEAHTYANAAHIQGAVELLHKPGYPHDYIVRWVTK